ncbi:PhaM family polyhydroxyalkanoate granule multifunctional regulatory protein [Massilia sp. HP4]|uniref:PhaM family polyhydroxyalkanoate granule multifunctional regulatory protein n=1 Tax=Massilia sp. HP4 TaxID=2562316 RepID=UPI00197E1801|nr:PhaM family polyhydroxyalkanoate granule multifunctional regulatory protein [Massilia sp. HP4]
MLNQPMPGMNDTLEFVKNLWGGMNIPGAMSGMGGMPMPGAGLSVEDLDKKIADLKAVESWLNLNLSMLRGSIQALEIQRGTLATLKAMGDSMAQAMSQTGAASDAAMAPFAQFFTQASQAAAPAQAAKPADAPAAPPPESPAPPPAGTDAQAAAMPAAVAWWNLLQDQFRQAVASAMPPEGAGSPDAAPRAGGDSPAAPTPAHGAGATPGKPASADNGAQDSAQDAGGAPASGKRTTRGKADKA